jgi:hypothetical protein
MRMSLTFYGQGLSQEVKMLKVEAVAMRVWRLNPPRHVVVEIYYY